MGVGERRGDVPQEPEHLGDGQLAFAREARAERFALDERHGEVGQPAQLARGVHGNDVRMLQLGHEQDLAAEAVRAHPGGERGRQDLHDNAAAQGGLVRQEDARHPAPAELALDRVEPAQRLLKLLAEVRRCPLPELNFMFDRGRNNQILIRRRTLKCSPAAGMRQAQSTAMVRQRPWLKRRTLRAHRVACPARMASQMSIGSRVPIRWMMKQMPSGTATWDTSEM